jgi:membrane associated rhomboid family serine protease
MSVDQAFPPSSGPRRKLLRRLLPAAEGGGDAPPGDFVLLRSDERASILQAEPKGVPVFVVDAEEPEALRARLGAAITDDTGAPFFLVVAGGSAGVREILIDLSKRVRDLRDVGFYHLGSDLSLDHVAGRRAPVLESGARDLKSAAPLDDAELAAAATRARNHRVEAARFYTALRGRVPLVSLVLGGLCVLLWIAGQLAPRGPFGEPLFLAGANIAGAVRDGQYWRLLASAFLHKDITHLAANMLSLYFVGTFVEQVIGRWRYLVVYGVSALVGAAASALLGDPARVSVGASGAIWGVMTAGFGLAMWPRGALPAIVAARLRQGLAMPLLINVGISFLPQIDLRAHFGGGAVGLAMALAGLLGNPIGAPATAEHTTRVETPVTWGTKMVAVMVALAVVLSLGLAVTLAFQLAQR